MKQLWIEEFRLCIGNLMDAPCVRRMQQFPQHGDVSTLEHCLMVAFISYVICRFLGLNRYAAARGGLLHDLFLYGLAQAQPLPGASRLYPSENRPAQCAKIFLYQRFGSGHYPHPYVAPDLLGLSSPLGELGGFLRR